MIPENWDNVTLEGYAAFQRSLKEEPDTTAGTVELSIKRAMYITGCELDEAEAMTIDDYSNITKLIKAPMPQVLQKRFKLNGINYRFKLLSGTRTGGELAAINNVAKRGVIDNLHQIMFLISEPIKWTITGWKPYEFEAKDVADRINDFKQMTLGVANPAAVFFSEVRKELHSLLENFLLKEMGTLTEQMKEQEAILHSLTD